DGTEPGGHKRSKGDRHYSHPERGLYFVTDGMANEVTPHFVLETLPLLIRDEFAGVEDLSGPEPPDKMQSVLAALNEQVRHQRLDLWGDGMIGATLVLALVRGGQALLAHLGDSRIYLHRAGRLEQLTRDHSTVQRMLDSGQITAAEAILARCQGGPTRYIGMPGHAAAGISLLPLEPGDRLLLCSDGLPDMLLEDDILAVLKKSPELDTACQCLVAAANAAAGPHHIPPLLIPPPR